LVVVVIILPSCLLLAIEAVCGCSDFDSDTAIIIIIIIIIWESKEATSKQSAAAVLLFAFMAAWLLCCAGRLVASWLSGAVRRDKIQWVMSCGLLHPGTNKHQSVI